MTREDRKKGLRALAEIILSRRNSSDLFVIYPHVRADGDAYGSSFALMDVFEQLGINAVVLLEEEISPKMHFMKGDKTILIWPEMDELERIKLLERQKLAIQLDSSEASRFASRIEAYESAEIQMIIDHHISEKQNSDTVFVDYLAAANVELIYTLILLLEEITGMTLLNKYVASCIYTGLLTDSGGFSYGNTSAETLQIASELLDYNVQVASLNNHLFKETPWTTLKIEAELLLKLQRSSNEKITYLVIDKSCMQDLKISDDDLEGLPAKIRDIKGVVASLLLRETRDGKVRGNLRSVGDNDISTIARKFGGGGHKNASGFTVEGFSGELIDLAKRIVKDMNTELGLDGKEE